MRGAPVIQRLRFSGDEYLRARPYLRNLQRLNLAPMKEPEEVVNGADVSMEHRGTRPARRNHNDSRRLM